MTSRSLTRNGCPLHITFLTHTQPFCPLPAVAAGLYGECGSSEGGTRDRLGNHVHPTGVSLSADADSDGAALNEYSSDIKQRITDVVESAKEDGGRSAEFFGYVWTMMCVKRGLMRVIDEIPDGSTMQLLVEEVRTGHHRLVARPRGVDRDIEGLAVQALDRILNSSYRP